MSNPLDTDAGSELFNSYEAELKLLGQMRLEKSNIPTSSRGKVNQRFRNYESDIDTSRRKLNDLSSDRSALFGSRYTDDPSGPSDIHLEQRQQLLSGTDRLDRSTQRLKASQALANETEDIGAGTLADLHRQRETIQHTHDRLMESEGYVDRSVKTLRGMARRMATNRIITISIITVLVLLILLVIYSKFSYVGTLHEINSEESTVSLENVRSFGSEGRKGKDEIAPSDQVYEYIVFRGSDVKDLRIEEHPGIKENKPPAVPDDPAILGARPCGAPGGNQNAPSQGPPQGPQGQQYPPNPNFQGGPPGQWGRGGPGPVPGPAFGNMPYPYPPPPGWFPGQGFPPGGPGAPGPWQNQPFPPGGPQGGPGPQGPPQTGKPEPRPVETPSGPAVKTAPTLPVESKPSTAAVKAAASNLGANGAPGPNQRNNKVNPVIPLTNAGTKPFSLPHAEQRTAQPAAGPAAGPNSVQDATSAARAAVAVAMAQLGNGAGNAMDNLTNKVNEMKVNAGRPPTAPRGRGRGGRVTAATVKVEVPNSDFDFAEANKKFNKDEIKQPGDEAEGAEVEEADGSDATAAVYNKSTSFFDNISSEAKDRASNGQKPGGREWRGEEQRKNMETFGQGSVDGGYRNYRGRGRGRGGRGRGGRGRGGRPQYQAGGGDL
ncbi:hypothetical protein LLEC1_03475 [Akanthomyces lecanii]|uniref:t-SNARE coiled-coil homology domain-containing protein n=1 Tax=Cordyceps confragosa TaxID=2714763 RepID=A0A179IBC7_CORDF|nr:hypothetical protein LLEC1_03475 [Akanthomyces lecanii]